jgi:hypothetical protein
VALKTLGRYRILGELGRGAMGVVYRAVDPLIEREVALKALHADLPHDVAGEVRVRFLREARSAGRLSHPNIVTIFDVGEDGGAAYIAMELLEGPSLQQMLRERRPISFHTAADLIAQVAEALDHAHQHAIVHRDVKPANVVVSRAGRAKLTDFGVAYVPASDVTQHGSALGSPRYMAPEQVLGQPIDARADIFSLGVVLYELLTRRTPFEWPGDTTVFALMQRIAGEPHPPLRQIDAAIPAGFDRIMDRALAKRPQDRYPSAAELAADLRNYHSLAGGTEFADTVPQAVLRPPAEAAEAQKMRGQLIEDLDQFAKNFEAQEARRLREEEAARLRKEQALQSWGAVEERKREAFERGERPPPETDPNWMTTTRRMAAVEIMRQQAAFRKAQAEAKPKAMAALDAAMRAALRYLAEFAKEMNEHQPRAGRALRVHLRRQAARRDAVPGGGVGPHAQAARGARALRADPVPLRVAAGGAAEVHAPGRRRRPLRAVPEDAGRRVPDALAGRRPRAAGAVRGHRPAAERGQHPRRLRGGDRDRRADQRAALRPLHGTARHGRLPRSDRRAGALRARRRRRLPEAHSRRLVPD